MKFLNLILSTASAVKMATTDQITFSAVNWDEFFSRGDYIIVEPTTGMYAGRRFWSRYELAPNDYQYTVYGLVPIFED